MTAPSGRLAHGRGVHEGAAMLQQLEHWRAQGWLQALDLAAVRFLHALDPQAPAGLLLAATLLAQLEGRGHSALPLTLPMSELLGLLDWPDEGRAALQAALAPVWPGGQAAHAARPEAWAGWCRSPLVQADPADERQLTPLVLSGGRLYLRRHWRDERCVARAVMARVQGDAVMAWTEGRMRLARRWMDALFPPPAAAAGDAGADADADVNLDDDAEADRVDWQRVACALGLRGRLTLISGGPGTGKTYTAARLLVLLQALHEGDQPLRVALAAPTGKAAARLRQSIEAALATLPTPVPPPGPAPVGTGAGSMPRSDPAAARAPALQAPARTLHALLGVRPGSRRFVHDAEHPLPLDLLFVDEASMVHLEMMAALLQALPPQARLVLLGDRDQLASVEAGAVLADLCQPVAGARPNVATAATAAWVQAVSGEVLAATTADPGHALAQQTVVLRQSRRFAGPIGQLARAVNRGDAAAALALLQSAASEPLAMLRLFGPSDAAAVPRRAVAGDGTPAATGMGYRQALAALAQRPKDPAAFDAWALGLLSSFERCRVLCALREGAWGVQGLNQAIERELAGAGLLARRGEWYEGRPVMVTRNEPALGLANGDIGLVLRPPAGTAGATGAAGENTALRAYFQDGVSLRSVAVGRLAAVDTAFAMTVHKSQGSEFGHVLLVLPPDDSPVLTRELLYTGITRARQALTLVLPDARRLGQACARQTRRLSGLREMLADPPAPPPHQQGA